MTDETKTDESTEDDVTEETVNDSVLDDLIESIEEVVEEKSHWLFGKMFGKD